jgi:fructose-1,6-bisphosphatase/inositol monophosphatase family enzyme
MGFAREIETAKRAAVAAGKVALRHQIAGFSIETKPDRSPVTIADRECERLIAATLSEAFPNDGILGEEGAQKDSHNGRRWIIDPIDGTRDFVRGNYLWCTLIGLEQENEVVAGVAYFPVLEQIAWASRAEGAFRNGAKLRVSSISERQNCVALINPDYHVADSFWARRWLGGTPDAIMVAAGEADIWLEPKVAPWDLAAVHVILEEAGAVFFDLTGARTIYGGSAVACTPGLEQEVKNLIRGPAKRFTS